eukprot:350478-Rhodomonas_salina.2
MDFVMSKRIWLRSCLWWLATAWRMDTYTSAPHSSALRSNLNISDCEFSCSPQCSEKDTESHKPTQAPWQRGRRRTLTQMDSRLGLCSSTNAPVTLCLSATYRYITLSPFPLPWIQVHLEKTS